MAEVSVDTDSCIGAGQCVLAAPEVFDQDEDGIVWLLTPRPDESVMDAVREAGKRCPSRSITVTG